MRQTKTLAKLERQFGFSCGYFYGMRKAEPRITVKPTDACMAIAATMTTEFALGNVK